MDLSKSLWDVRSNSVVSVLPYVVSILLIIASGWYQARQTMARQQSSANASPVNSQMQFMTKVFPVVFGVLSLRFASGLIVYWVTSNAWRIGQQHLVLNKIYDEAQKAPPPKARDDEDEEDDSDADEGPDDSGSGGPKGGGSKTGGQGSKGSGGAAKGAAAASVRRPGAPKRDPNRTPTSASGNRNGTGNGSGKGTGTGNGSAKGTGNGSGKGTATPASAGNRRKKRKR
jgi:YidC/Oxa1 family membrane protein insertase